MQKIKNLEQWKRTDIVFVHQDSLKIFIEIKVQTLCIIMDTFQK